MNSYHVDLFELPHLEAVQRTVWVAHLARQPTGRTVEHERRRQADSLVLLLRGKGGKCGIISRDFGGGARLQRPIYLMFWQEREVLQGCRRG